MEAKPLFILVQDSCQVASKEWISHWFCPRATRCEFLDIQLASTELKSWFHVRLYLPTALVQGICLT